MWSFEGIRAVYQNENKFFGHFVCLKYQTQNVELQLRDSDVL